MRKCKKCCVEKELGFFQTRKGCIGGRRPICRLCAKIVYREQINKLKDVPCADCGGKFDPVVMDFDHVRGEKLFNISVGVGTGQGIRKILAEIEKCEVVCANCHRLRTEERG